jgi:fatty-acyl-CoA synthase
MGEKPATTYENLKPWIRHIHLKDSVLEGDHTRYVLPGYGDLPLTDVIGLLQEGGYAGFYSLEWIKRWDWTLEEPGIVFAHYVGYMRSFA